MQLKTKYLIWAVVLAFLSFVFVNQISTAQDVLAQSMNTWYILASTMSGMGAVGLSMAYFSEY